MGIFSQHETFSQHYNDYFEKIYNYIYFRVGNSRQLAEEYTQDIFIKALEHFDTFDHNSSFSSWIFRIAHNYLVDHYRKKKIAQHDIEDVANSIVASKDAKDTFVKDIDTNIDLNLVKSALKELSQIQQELIILRYINEYEIEEIADITGKEANYVRVNIHRALQKLQDNIRNNK